MGTAAGILAHSRRRPAARGRGQALAALTDADKQTLGTLLTLLLAGEASH